jgi:hypothetical protein
MLPHIPWATLSGLFAILRVERSRTGRSGCIKMHQRLALYHARAAKEAGHFSQGWWMHQNRHEKRAGEAGEKRVLRGGSAEGRAGGGGPADLLGFRRARGLVGGWRWAGRARNNRAQQKGRPG